MAGLSRGWGKSITVIIMTMEANSTATSAILKPSAAPAYQRAPWDRREAERARPRFTHTAHTPKHPHTHSHRIHLYFVYRGRHEQEATHQQKEKFMRQLGSLSDTVWPRDTIKDFKTGPVPVWLTSLMEMWSVWLMSQFAEVQPLCTTPSFCSKHTQIKMIVASKPPERKHPESTRDNGPLKF